MEPTRQDYGSSVQRSCKSSFYVPIILERKDAVMLALLGKQRGRVNEQSLEYAKNWRLRTLLFSSRYYLSFKDSSKLASKLLQNLSVVCHCMR